MNFEPLDVLARPGELHDRLERIANAALRGWDGLLGALALGGRKGPYDDEFYEFVGGAADDLRLKHYDKSLRLLWKAQPHAPWSTFRDASPLELRLAQSADAALGSEERQACERLRSPAFRELLDAHYTPAQKQALVNVLSLIGHGEAYAWLVSTELLNEVQSTGGRAAVTMQVLEEAKHFVVLRELIHAFDCDIPRLSAWEYFLLERAFKARGLEKLFAMNVLVEGFALSLFGLLGELPGLELLRLMHLDESRHSALPQNYLSAFPLGWWARRSPWRRAYRLSLLLPALPVLVQIERDLALLGIDSFELGGSIARKIIHHADRTGFHMALGPARLRGLLNALFNGYCRLSRPGHERKDYLGAETTRAAEARDRERKVYGDAVREVEAVA